MKIKLEIGAVNRVNDTYYFEDLVIKKPVVFHTVVYEVTRDRKINSFRLTNN